MLVNQFQFVELYSSNDTERRRAVTKRTAPSTNCLRRLAAKFQFVQLMHRTTKFVILSERQRVEESTHFGHCNANIWCEDPSAPFHAAQDDKAENSTKAIRRALASDRSRGPEDVI